MGGWMDYERMRRRNNILVRGPALYVPMPLASVNAQALNGDLNRMEQDYCYPTYPDAPWATRPEASDPGMRCAIATGVDVETVRKVLRHVFALPPAAALAVVEQETTRSQED